MDQNEEYRKRALDLAGKMADAAIALVGGRGLNGNNPSCAIDLLSSRGVLLRRAVENYNDLIIEWAQYKDRTDKP